MWNPLKRQNKPAAGEVSSRSTASGIDLDILACPRCHAETIVADTSDQLRCPACNATYPVKHGVPVLLKDAYAKTKLDLDEYNAGHKISDQQADALYKQWERVFNQFDASGGNLLEIGCGTGLLTYGLIKNNRFDCVHASDISPQFIGAAKELLSDLEGNASFYACDANHLPFKPSGFNVIVGNSVLHHFLDYPDTIQQCYRILKPGGVAVFYEPVLQGKSMIAFFMDLIIRTDQQFKLNVFSEEQIENIQKQITHQTTIPKIRGQRERLSHIEDKYIFDLTEFEQLAKDIGFADFDYLSANDILPRSYKPGIMHTMGYFGVTKEQINQFDFIFESFHSTYAEVMGSNVVTPMVYSVFRR